MFMAATLISILLIAGCTQGSGAAQPTQQPTRQAIQEAQATPTAASIEPELKDLPTAPESARVDLATPKFSDPTSITNPLFPVSSVSQTLLLGNVDGVPLRVEYTLLPKTKTIAWNGQQVETLEVQYVAHLGGRIHEVALDWYAQADDGAVWYLGEDVFNYEDGIVADTEGTWLAGRDGPAAMIMPANPQVGDVYRPENIPGLVFEEVTVKSIGMRVAGPRGVVEGAVVVSELHMDGTFEEKTFAPGYGEFYTGSGSDLEAVALAVPTDALSGAMPAELNTLLTGALEIFDAVEREDRDVLKHTMDSMTFAWGVYQGRDVPKMLEAQMTTALESLAGTIETGEPADARHAAIEAARASLDLQLQYRPLAEIELVRFDLWARQVLS
jgi:hypothetical protein